MSLPLTLLSLSYICFPSVDMRQEPKQDSEIVSQAYFSEEVKVLEEAHEWMKIKTTADDYAGWVEKHSICYRDKPFDEEFTKRIAKISKCTAHIYDREDTIFGPILTLPFDSKLGVLNSEEIKSDSRWIKVALIDGREGYIQRGAVNLNDKILNKEEICELSLQFKGLPYTWGGRSSFGYDCSGFVQMLYRQMGIFLPRDTKDQINWNGFSAISIADLKRGDLIFFGLAEDKIRHVGLYLGNNEFIHSTVAENNPYIHISNIKEPEWDGSGRFKYVGARTVSTDK
jgi:gamma-D-glutamyl-L-lysine dipeptidyl-peptidase